MDAWIVDAVRTPRGRARPDGALAGVRPVELVAGLVRALLERTGTPPAAIDELVLGISTQVGEQGANLGRIAALWSGLPERVAGAAVCRFCASGLDAIDTAAAKLHAGMADVVLAGGVESMSRVPILSDRGAWFADVEVARRTGFVPMGVAADLLAARDGLGRAALEAYALESHRRAARAAEAGARALVPVRDASGTVLLARDECVRADMTPERLAKLAPAFVEAAASVDPDVRARVPDLPRAAAVHTVGTSPAIADGASLVLLARGAAVARLGLRPRVRIRGFADVAGDPIGMLAETPAAVRRAAERAGIAPGELALHEINESFAAVPLHYARAMGVDAARLNVAGGAIALGHPLGATGGVLVSTLLDELERAGERLGVAGICAGAGLATATILERV